MQQNVTSLNVFGGGGGVVIDSSAVLDTSLSCTMGVNDFVCDVYHAFIPSCMIIIFPIATL